MKILKGKLHIQFGDLMAGDTFMFDGSPCIKVGGSAGADKDKVLEKIKNDPNYLNGVHLETGMLYHYPKDKRVEKVELGVTGLEGTETED